MTGKRLLIRAALLWVAALAVWIPPLARAVDVPLPGERKVEIHGFYEFRMRAFHNDNVTGPYTLSQFRHVLNIETDIDLFPEGVGPFDFVSGFTRWIISYECVYTRACGLFNGVDSFGGADRQIKQQSSHFKSARNPYPEIAGLFQTPYIPGTLRKANEKLNPGGRYRTCLNADGQIANPFPLAAFCNFDSQTVLGTPSLPFSPGVGASPPSIVQTRAGSFNIGLLPFDYRSTRDRIDAFGLPTDSEFAARPSSGIENTVRALSLIAESKRLAKAGLDQQADVLLNLARTLIPEQTRAGLVYRRDQFGVQPEGNPTPDGVPDVLQERTNANRFFRLARVQAPDLTRALWGSQNFSSTNIPWLGTINTEIQPYGYFYFPAADTISQNAIGLALQGGFANSTAGGEFLLRVDGTTVTVAELKNQGTGGQLEVALQVPAFFGPDGIGSTPDDLPIAPLVDLREDVRLLDEGFAPIFDPRTGTVDNPDKNLVATQGTVVQVYRAVLGNASDPGYDPLDPDRDGGFDISGSIKRFVDPGAPGAAACNADRTCSTSVQPQTSCFGQLVTIDGKSGIRPNGVNAKGECVVLATNANIGTQVTANLVGDGLALSRYEAFAALRDENTTATGGGLARPGTAVAEPTDLTDLFGRSVRRGQGLPARPPNPDGGVFFQTANYRKFVKDHHHVFSNLDLDFTENELRWEHGASQDNTNEFREGYIEGEFADSQVYFRTGKLLMVWGKTELFRNQDRMNPLDIGIGTLARLEEARVGQWATTMTFSPEMWMNVGPAKDVRLELAVIYNDFQPTDLGKCGEGLTFSVVCNLSFGAMAHGLAGIGVAGESRAPDIRGRNTLSNWDYGVRLEGRFDRFTFALTDFWGWDDGLLLENINQYARKVDTTTGAPVASITGTTCGIRRNSAGVAIGPDSIIASGDENIASSGSCLLWAPNKAKAPGGAECSFPEGTPLADVPPECVQGLRASSDIATLHASNQTVFHSVCTLTFDETLGRCALDILNDINVGTLISSLLAGSEVVAGIAVQGWDSMKIDAPGGFITQQSGDLTDAEVVGLQNQLRNIRAQPDISQTFITTNLVAATGSAVPNQGGVLQSPFDNLNVSQKALLGCGPSFVSDCDGSESAFYAQNENLSNELGLGRGEPSFGGVDLLNADASVFLQEFSVIHSFSPTAGVGSRGGVRAIPGVNKQVSRPLFTYDDGVTTSGFATKDLIDNATGELGEDGVPDNQQFLRVTQNGVNLSRDLLTLDAAGDLTYLDPVNGPTPVDVSGGTRAAAEGTPFLATDFEVEGNKWLVDEEQRLQGVLLYQDPRGPDGIWQGGDPNSDDVVNLGGEYCGVVYPNATGGIDPGCTVLEILSANFERFLMQNEIIGGDDAFDPAETLLEFDVMTNGIAFDDFQGDPIAGADGVVFADWIVEDSFNTSGDLLGIYGFRSDDPDAPVQMNTAPTTGDPISIYQKGVSAPVNFLNVYDPTAQAYDEGCDSGLLATSPNGYCYVRLAKQVGDRDLVGGLPAGAVAYQLNDVVAGAGNVILDSATGVVTAGACVAGEPGCMQTATITVPLQTLNMPDVGIFDALLEKCSGAFGNFCDTLPSSIISFTCTEATPGCVPGETVTRRVMEYHPEVPGIGFTRASRTVSLGKIDNDQDNFPDIDSNADGNLDLLDDGTVGPASDDNPLCGSGIPGDPLQDVSQYEFSAAEQEQLVARGGIPARSPIFCSSVSGLLGATGQTLPRLQAGGTGRFGRRDFLWHAGRQVKVDFQRKNVLGMSMDFAEGRTKTSWGIEFSWTSGRLFPTTFGQRGLADSDDYALTVSVDRPSFFNFLNPNRSFFINFQFFLRYLPGYEGGSGGKNGMFGVQHGAWDGLATLFFFTGYFQDRLQPRFIFVYSPTSQSGGVLTGLSYRWNDAFSTALAWNSFFGQPVMAEGSDFPIALRSTIRTSNEAITRGLNAVRHRDVAVMTMRYTF